jgi:hypothetical protein
VSVHKKKTNCNWNWRFVSSGIWRRPFWYKCNNIGSGDMLPASSRQIRNPRFRSTCFIQEHWKLRLVLYFDDSGNNFPCLYFYQNAWRRVSEDVYLRGFNRENVKSHRNRDCLVLCIGQAASWKREFWHRGHYEDLRQSCMPKLATQLNRNSPKMCNE